MIAVETCPEARSRSVLWLFVPAGACMVFWLPGINDAFLDWRGFNGAQWGLGVDAIARDGLLTTKFGAIRSGSTYANHPPLMITVEWMSQTLLGRERWVLRLPLILASLASLGLMWRLAGRTTTSALAVVVAASTPMFLVHGSMIDTWIMGLPLGIGVLIALQGKPSSWHALLAASCALCSWQGVILVGLAVPVALWRFGLRSSLAQGAVIGAGLAVAYGDWAGAGGSVLELGWPFDGPSLRMLWEMFGPALALVPVALWHRDRAIAVLSIAAPAIYGIAMTWHADMHPYWFYWWLIPILIGARVVLEHVSQVAAVGMALVAVGWLLNPPPQEALDARRVEIVRAVRAVDQPWIPVVEIPEGAPWVEYETRRPVKIVDAIDVPAGYMVISRTPSGMVFGRH